MPTFEQMLAMSGTLDTTDLHPGDHSQLVMVSHAFRVPEPVSPLVKENPSEPEPEVKPEPEPEPEVKPVAAKRRAPAKTRTRTTKQAQQAPAGES